MSALIERTVKELSANITEVTEVWDLSHPDCPIDLLQDLVADDKAFVTVVSTYLADDRTIH